MRFKSIYLLSAILLWPSFASAADWTLTLPQVEEAALQNSDRLKAAEFDWLAADQKARGQWSQLGPKLSIDAGYRHVSEVPVFVAVPNAPPVRFGDNKNYSYGPAVNWLIWDSGGIYNSARSFRAYAESKRQAYEAEKRRILQSARLTYFQVQLTLEQMRAIADSIKLSADQYRDIGRRRRAGTLSQIDELAAHQDVLNRQREFRQSQTELSLALRELFALIGGQTADVDSPVDSRVSDEMAIYIDTPTVRVRVDELKKSKAAFLPAADYKWDEHHPNVEIFRELAESAHRASQSLAAGHFPIVNFSARSTRDYPNGPILESFHQNTIAVAASLSLFEWNRVRHETKEQSELSRAQLSQAEQAAIDLKRDWEKAQDQVRGLEDEQLINKVAVEEGQKLARLVYDSYKAGGSTFLEVENANLKLLLSDVAMARTDVQILIQLTILDSLSVRE